MHRIVVLPEAQSFVDRASPPLQRKLLRCFDALAANPRGGNNVKPLTGNLRGSWRYRIGDHRVIYRIVDSDLVVSVVRVVPRSDAYR